MKPQSYVVMGVRIHPELKHELQRLAKADKRSLSNFVEILLTEAIKQKAQAA